MTIQLFSRFHEQIPLSRNIPTRFKPQEIHKADKLVGADDKNEFLFQDISCPDFTIRFQSLFLRKPNGYFIECEGNICLQVSLYRTLTYDLAGFDNGVPIHHRRFNIMFSPMMKFRYHANPFTGSFLSFELWFTKALLQRCAEKYTAAATFLNDVEKGMPAKLFEQSQSADVEMMALIDLIVIIGQQQEADADWIAVYAQRILELAFQDRQAVKKVKLKPEGMRRIYETVDLLTELESKEDQIKLAAGIMEVSPHDLAKEVANSKPRMDYDNWTVDDIAAFAGMTRYAFQKAFKEMYNCTVREYPRVLAWQSALNILLSGSANLKSIAAFTGFHTQGNFSRAFKKRFGRTPIEFVQDFQENFKNYKNLDKRINGKNLDNGHQLP